MRAPLLPLPCGKSEIIASVAPLSTPALAKLRAIAVKKVLFSPVRRRSGRMCRSGEQARTLPPRRSLAASRHSPSAEREG